MKIQRLPEEVASQIAAGEVIERPASVVKELVENSLDAGASQIEIAIREAGKRLIEVIDDGRGIPGEQLPLTVVRHATSKLSTADDLFRIETLGFRGEALASVGSVSQMTITSRSEEDEIGARIKVMGGEVEQVSTAGAAPGTVVQVSNLFYNVPARLKFLKTDRTEKRRIKDMVTTYALANPGVAFRLTVDGRAAFQTTGQGDLRETLIAVFGLDVGKKMIPVLAKEDILDLEGFISPPDLTRSNRREITFFVNRRPVQDIALTKALTQAYHTLLMKGRYPLAVLFLEIDPELVDVNVHPTKAEVRFRNKSQVFRAVEKGVRRALLAHTPVPELGQSGSGGLWNQGSPSTAGERRGSGRRSWPEGRSFDGQVGEEDGGSDQTTPHQAEMRTPILRLIGQVAATYLIAEGPDGLYLVDQHAAHERVLFERFLAERQDQAATQSLLEAEIVEFSPSAADLLEEEIPLLREIGFEVEVFGLNTFKVRGVPALIAEVDPRSSLRAVVEDLEVNEAPLEKEREEKIIARVCKKAAIKAGQVLSPPEQKALLKDLEACQNPRTCPHGRPTMIHLSVDLLERKFGRTGPR